MNDQNDEQTRLLREILKWIRFSGMKEVKTALANVLDSDQKRLVYHLSDGTRGIVEIGKIMRIGSTSTIFDMWQAWLKGGLGESFPVKGGSRFKRSFELDDFGIEVPQLKRETSKEKPLTDQEPVVQKTGEDVV